MDILNITSLKSKGICKQIRHCQASWPYERRVVCKIEKPEGQILYYIIYVCLYCNQHGFIAKISYQILLQKKSDGKLYKIE